MMLHDPFIGYLAAIAATIQLEHTLSKHADVAAAATLSFRSAIRYLKKLSKYWNSIAELVSLKPLNSIAFMLIMFQLGIVEELAARLRHRHTLYYSQDDYDGILPAVESERVGLAGDDMSLMWKVFDYASMSALNGRPSRSAPTTTNARQAESLPLQPQAQSVAPSNVGNLPASESEWGSMPPNNMTPNFEILRGTQAGLEQPNLSLFDQIPEDWAFTIDDWTLFGAPGSTYFYNETS